MKKLVLASGSQGRKEILDKLGIPFVVDVSDYEEDMTMPLEPKELAVHLSQGKAQAVAKRHTSSVILAADSFAVHNGKLLGKPHTKEKAIEMLQELSGQTHLFITGYTLIDTDSGKSFSEAVETKVYFLELSKEMIERYLDKENVLEKAASYIIQGLGGALIDKIEGDHYNITGLPLSRVVRRLRDFGITVL